MDKVLKNEEEKCSLSAVKICQPSLFRGPRDAASGFVYHTTKLSALSWLKRVKTKWEHNRLLTQCLKNTNFSLRRVPLGQFHIVNFCSQIIHMYPKKALSRPKSKNKPSKFISKSKTKPEKKHVKTFSVRHYVGLGRKKIAGWVSGAQKRALEKSIYLGGFAISSCVVLLLKRWEKCVGRNSEENTSFINRLLLLSLRKRKGNKQFTYSFFSR